MTQEKLLSKELMKNQAVLDTRRFLLCKECDQSSAKMSVRSETERHSKSEWESILLPALDSGKTGLFPLTLRVSFEQNTL